MKVPDGWIQQPDGSYSHPSRVRRAVEAGVTQPVEGGALERDAPKRKARRPRVAGSRAARDPDGPVGGGGAAVIVHLDARLNRLMDEHDNLRASLKPLVDGIAASLGVPDNHPGVRWCYSQTHTIGEPCVVVTVEGVKMNARNI